ncbi:unnamed protein product [Pleuronectes platessa]|uniref:Uncharacterized protein n=1 Tax=Pleuronectes platessa TaxID=8262 RepID=A0A9N7UJU9_PLEPL|nr:unnamed protein product [Pleuronectes platessa]
MIDAGGPVALVQRGAASVRREMIEVAYDKRTVVYVEGCVRVSSSWGLSRGSEPWPMSVRALLKWSETKSQGIVTYHHCPSPAGDNKVWPGSLCEALTLLLVTSHACRVSPFQIVLLIRVAKALPYLALAFLFFLRVGLQQEGHLQASSK